MPQGGVLSPLLANIYLTEVDAMLERAKRVTREGAYTRVDYARYADDLVILVDWHPAEINPILRGWVNYFRIGNARRCLAYVRLWVEQRVRRHLPGPLLGSVRKRSRSIGP